MERTTPASRGRWPRRAARAIAFWAVLVVAVPALAAEAGTGGRPPDGRAFYVSPSGDDGNPGTSPETAWRTIDRVNRGDYRAGDRILLEGGQRFEGAVLLTRENAHGKKGNPVVLGSYGDGRATITTPDQPGLSAVSALGVGGVYVTHLVLAGANPAGAGSGVLFGAEKEQV